jgi:hypothetical protein
MKRQQLVVVLALAGALAACQAHTLSANPKASSSSTTTTVPTTLTSTTAPMTAPTPTTVPRVLPSPSDEAVLGAIPECANGGCALFDRHDGFASPDGPATLAFVHVPHPGYGEAVDGGVYLVSDGGALVWSTHPTDMFGPGGGKPQIDVDDSGNALVPVSTGAHNGFVGVVRVTPSGVEDFGSFEMVEPFFGNGGAGRVRPDPTQPALDQLLIGQDDCTPSCAEGSTTFTVLSWNGSQYVVTGVEAA